jgi:hypothetical protein
MNYNNLQNMAHTQILDKGLQMSIIRQSNVSFNVSTGSYATATTTSYPCYGVRLDFKKKDQIEGTLQKNSLQGMQNIEENRVLFLVAAKNLSIIPERDDRVKFAFTTYEVEEVETLSPNGIDLLYKIKARK